MIEALSAMMPAFALAAEIPVAAVDGDTGHVIESFEILSVPLASSSITISAPPP